MTSSIEWRATLAGAVVLAVTFVLLLITPVTVSAPIRAGEVLILSAGLLAMLTINVMLVRRALSPVRDLAERLDQVDLREPTVELLGEVSSPELATFSRSFDRMIMRLQEERRGGARAAVTAQERERVRVARALHDEAGQTLTAITLEIERMAESLAGPDRVRMHELAAQLHDGLDEIRRISRELRPEALDDLGLVNALLALTLRLSTQGDIEIRRRFSPELPKLSPELELIVYRVAQEALTNVLRHAEASRCEITLSVRSEQLELVVDDDGIGLAHPGSAETVGIEGMRERALLAGGTLTIESVAGDGTTVVLRIPLAQVS